MYDSEDALAAHPHAVLIPDLTVVEDSCFVKLDAPAVDGSREGDLIGMEVFPAGFPHYLLR